MKQLTVKIYKGSKIESCYGEIDYGTWCAKEIDRLRNDGVDCFLQVSGNKVCIVEN